MELDPQSSNVNTFYAAILYFARHYDEAIRQSHRALELDPNSWVTYWVLNSCYDAKGMYEEGARAQQRNWELYKDAAAAAPGLLAAQAQGGYHARMRYTLTYFLKRSQKSNNYFGEIAAQHALLGEKDKAFYYLDRAYQEYDAWIFQLQDPMLDSLHDDPRWLAFLRRLNLQDTPLARLPAAPAPAAH